MPSRSDGSARATIRLIPMHDATFDAASRCLSLIIGTSTVTARARPPSVLWAMSARTVLSSPPEKHTVQEPVSSRRRTTSAILSFE